MKHGIILYGAPASGKSSITSALTDLDSRIRLFKRVKHGAGRTNGYRMTSAQELANMRERGEIVWENENYGATYAVNDRDLYRALQCSVPVLHVGQPEAVRATTNRFPNSFFVVSLLCGRTETLRRLIARKDENLEARMAAYDTTPLMGVKQCNFVVDTERHSPQGSAKAILSRT